jgi:hypothetical protein
MTRLSKVLETRAPKGNLKLKTLTSAQLNKKANDLNDALKDMLKQWEDAKQSKKDLLWEMERRRFERTRTLYHNLVELIATKPEDFDDYMFTFHEEKWDKYIKRIVALFRGSDFDVNYAIHAAIYGLVWDGDEKVKFTEIFDADEQDVRLTVIQQLIAGDGSKTYYFFPSDASELARLAEHFPYLYWCLYTGNGMGADCCEYKRIESMLNEPDVEDNKHFAGVFYKVLREFYESSEGLDAPDVDICRKLGIEGMGSETEDESDEFPDWEVEAERPSAR